MAYYRAFCHSCNNRNIEEAAKIIAEEDFEINEVMMVLTTEMIMMRQPIFT